MSLNLTLLGHKSGIVVLPQALQVLQSILKQVELREVLDALPRLQSGSAKSLLSLVSSNVSTGLVLENLTRLGCTVLIDILSRTIFVLVRLIYQKGLLTRTTFDLFTKLSRSALTSMARRTGLCLNEATTWLHISLRQSLCLRQIVFCLRNLLLQC